MNLTQPAVKRSPFILSQVQVIIRVEAGFGGESGLFPVGKESERVCGLLCSVVLRPAAAHPFARTLVWKWQACLESHHHG